MTSIILLFIRFVLRIPLRMRDEDLLIGDDAVHGEDAYAFGDTRRSLLHGDTDRVPNNDDGELGIIHAKTPMSEHNNGESSKSYEKHEP